MPVNPFAFQQFIMPAPAVGSGGGSSSSSLAALGADLRQKKISQGYLDLQTQQLERSRQNDAIELMSKERDTRQAAIDAWLSAVRSGNRADVWTLGKRLQGMGINVQMPSSFVAAGPPEPTEQPTMAAPEAPPAAPKQSAEDEALGKQLDQIKQQTVSELSGQDQGRFMDLDTMKEETADEFNQRIAGQEDSRFMNLDTGQEETADQFHQRIAAQDAGQMGAPPPLQMGAPPMGPGGMAPPPAPPQTWRVSDPVTGTNLEIAPEDILADQEREIDQAFLPLVKMEGLDPIASRAYQVGHEYAKGQIGFMTPKEAAAAGMGVAEKYMQHMQRQGLLEVQKAKATKPKGGRGGGGGGAGFAAPGTARALQLVGGTSDNVTNVIAKQKQTEGYTKNNEALQAGRQTLGKLSMNMGVGERGALGDYMKAISGAAMTEGERDWYTSAAGFWSKLNNKLGYVVNGGRLDEKLVTELRQLIQEANSRLETRKSQIVQQGWGAAKAQIDLWLSEAGVTDEDRRLQYYNAARGELGMKPLRKKTSEQSADEVAKGL